MGYGANQGTKGFQEEEQDPEQIELAI